MGARNSFDKSTVPFLIFLLLTGGASDLLKYRPSNVSHALNNLVRSSEVVTFSF